MTVDIIESSVSVCAWRCTRARVTRGRLSSNSCHDKRYDNEPNVELPGFLGMPSDNNFFRKLNLR